MTLNQTKLVVNRRVRLIDPGSHPLPPYPISVLFCAIACHSVLIQKSSVKFCAEVRRTREPYCIFPLNAQIVSFRAEKKFIVFFVSESCLLRKNRVFEKSGPCFYRVRTFRNRVFFVFVLEVEPVVFIPKSRLILGGQSTRD